jgi:hypothetical protein
MSALSWIYRNVFNSVPFGIATMVCIALYIAVGSGWVGLRESLEMDEMLFFNWWPLKLLTVLLIINLTVVTVVRIPLTVPRYGVWCIHMGIILLLMSLSAYYTLKTEGLVPLFKGRTATTFYDRWERALYVRTTFGSGQPMALEGLPRFNEYDTTYNNADYLDRPTLRDLSPQTRTVDMKSDRRSIVPLHETLGLTEPVKLDVIAYYPFAELERWRVDPAVKNVGLRVREIDAPEGTGGWLVSSQPADAIIPVGEAALEHRHVPTKADVDLSTAAAKRLHKLTIQTPENKQEIFVEPGESVDVAGGAYTVQVDGFTPQFQLSDGKRSADTLTVLITKKVAPPEVAKPFRRTILSNLDPAETGTQTDFELNVEGAGPFGKRKRDGLLDPGIQLAYAFNDPTKLLPTVQQTTVKYLLITNDEAPGLTLLRVSSRDASVTLASPDDQVDLLITAPAPMFQGGADREIGRLNVRRFNNVALSNQVVSVPKEQRSSQAVREGAGQMIRVRVRCGDWSQEVPVPYLQFADQVAWGLSPKIRIPGAKEDFQLMMGSLVRPLPVAVRLDAFEPVAYAGGDLSGNGFMRDFKSTLSIINQQSGTTQTATASLNSPAFFRLPSPIPFLPGDSWLLSQANWNPSDLDQSTLQVGNRPAVHMMTVACVMIFVGLMYAFYAKPIIIRKMKERALREAQEKKQRRELGLVPAASATD